MGKTGKNNKKVQEVKIVSNNANKRATALRAQITNVLALKDCGTEKEFRVAMQALNLAFEKFQQAVI